MNVAVRVLAIDPGPTKSAFVLYEDAVVEHAIDDNEAVADVVEMYAMNESSSTLAIEMIASYGMAVGAEVFETCVWIGRFLEIWATHRTLKGHRLRRIAIKTHLCKSSSASDSNVRQALLDRFGGKTIAVGKKAAPGPLYGVKKDEWSALAIAVSFCDGLRDPAFEPTIEAEAW